MRKRLTRMLDEDRIKIVAVADPLKIGYPIVAVIGLHCLPSALKGVETALSELSEFRFIGLTTGAYDFVAEAWFQSIGELSAFLTERLAPIEGVRRIETASVLKMVRYAYDWGKPTTTTLPSPQSRVTQRVNPSPRDVRVSRTRRPAAAASSQRPRARSGE